MLLLILGSYAAVTVCGVSILLMVLSHFAAFSDPSDDAESSEAARA